MATERHIVGDPATPVLFESGFVESSTQNLDLRAAPGFLTAPLSLYPAAGRVIVLPYKFGESSRPYVESVASRLEGHSSRFVLVACNGDFWRAWLAGRFHNYTSYTIGGFGKITITVFQKR
jgi:hypothetical protein